MYRRWSKFKSKQFKYFKNVAYIEKKSRTANNIFMQGNILLGCI